MAILAELASDDVLDAAHDWLCRRRRAYPADADVWSFRQAWAQEKDKLKDGEAVDLWSARDALVLKALTIVLAKHLPVSTRCTHVKGHGGAKAAVRQVMANLPCNRFVLGTDVKAYYASIDHFILLDRLAEYVKDRRVLNLLRQYLRRTAERAGEFWDYGKGISLGCPLSPLIGAFFLKRLDERMERSGLFYVRFMDDILVLAPTRWRLRKAVKAVNEVLGSLGLLKHPDKTFIGRIERGFDFLGYHFGPDGLSVAKKTVENFVARAIRLYEQEPGEACASSRLGLYVRRWVRWVQAGLPEGRPPP
jgi:hypothetical protein